MKTRTFKIFISLFLAVFSTLTISAEKQPSLAEVWSVSVDLKDVPAFEEAVKKHNKYRVSKGDPRSWKFYTPVTGDEFGTYYIRFCCFEWKDLDSYDAWAQKNNILKHWRETAGKYVNHVTHYYNAHDMKNSKWPEKDPGYKYFEIIGFTPKQGMGGKINKRIEEFGQAGIDMKWPYSWSWSWRIGGATRMTLAIPYTDYASMEDPEMGFAEALGKHLKDPAKAKKMFEEWNGYFKSVESRIIRKREDLSMKDK